MLRTEIMAVFFEIHIKHTNLFCGRHVIIFRPVRKIAKKKAISFVISVHPSLRLSALNNSAPIGRIFMKFDI